MAIDDRTPNLNLALPNAKNLLSEDVGRLREALGDLDGILPAKADLVGGKVPNEQLPTLPTPIDNTDELDEGATNLYFTDQRARDAQQAATASVLGVVKVGSGLSVAGDGTLSAVGGGGGTGVPAFNELTIVPASNGQTAFVVPGGYSVGQIHLYLNGVRMYGNGDDYTASDGTNITLAVGVNTTDTLLLERWTTTVNLPFSSIVDKPTKVDGYGITDAVKKTGDQLTGALNEVALVSLASAATTNIGAQNANTISVTGTTTITSLGTAAAGAIRRLVFAGALTLTHNATSLILPGAANLITAAGDVAEFFSLGSGNWRCVAYQRASGYVTPAGVETLSNKALAGPTIAGTKEIRVAVPASAIDLAAGNCFTKTITATTTFTLSNVPAAGTTASFILELTNAGSQTVNLWAGVKWAGGTAPSPLTTAGVDILGFYTHDGGTTWRGMLLAKDSK